MFSREICLCVTILSCLSAGRRGEAFTWISFQLLNERDAILSQASPHIKVDHVSLNSLQALRGIPEIKCKPSPEDNAACLWVLLQPFCHSLYSNNSSSSNDTCLAHPSPKHLPRYLLARSIKPRLPTTTEPYRWLTAPLKGRTLQNQKVVRYLLHQHPKLIASIGIFGRHQDGCTVLFL